MLKIKSFLENVRAPRKDIPLNRQITETAGIILFGFALGVLQKWLDGTTAKCFSSDNTATGLSATILDAWQYGFYWQL